MEHAKQASNAFPILMEEHVYFGGMNLTYQLKVHIGNTVNRYRIRVIKDSESEEAELGTDLMSALQCYRKIVHGTVTPCALQAVMQELRYA